MCRNIRTLFNFEPPATEIEIRDASLQFVRKLSGFSVPSQGQRSRVRTCRGAGRGRGPRTDRLAGHHGTAARPGDGGGEGPLAVGGAFRAHGMTRASRRHE